MRLSGNPRTLVMTLCALAGAASALPVLALTYQVGHRPEIARIDAPKTVKSGQPVRILIEAKKEGGAGCGMVLRFGDGAEQQFKINHEGVKLPLVVEHVYKKDGKYTVRAQGREITTSKECKGSASATIQVGETKPPARKKP